MATQKGRNWSSGDIVTAANLSSIERGVSAVAEEYTPTTWANGNTVTAAALNNIEQGIANAGGGSSDFSTAQVTVVNNTTAEAAGGLLMAIINEDGYFVVNALPSGIYTVPLLNGVLNTSYVELRTISVSGNASEDDGDITITGDCTITISGESSNDDR